METATDQSYGVVPLFKNSSGEYEVLVVHQISHRSDRFWNFPKGHPEAQESGAEAALRELKEETGLSNVVLDHEKTFVIQYSFKDGVALVNKTVDYFIGYAASKETKITMPREIAELRWCSFAEAEQLLTHQNSRNILKEVVDYLG